MNSVLDSQVVLCTQSAIGHIPLRLIINMILTFVLTMPCPLTSSSTINWLKEHLVSNVHLLLVLTWMPTQRWENRALVAEVRWRRLALRCLVHVTRASWQLVLDSWQQASSRIAQTECTHLPELLVHRANQWASMYVCDRKSGGCGAIMNYVHSAASIAHKEAKARMKGKKKEVTTISQRAAQIVEGTHTKEQEDVVCPGCDRELYVFNTASGPILRCRGWTLAGTPCTLIKACHNGVIIPGGLQNTNRIGGGSSASGSGGPGTLPRRDDGIPNPLPLNDWTAQVQALAANPAWAQEQFTQWQVLHQQYQHLQYQQQLVAASTTDPWQVLPEDDGSTGDRWSMDTGTDRIGV